MSDKPKIYAFNNGGPRDFLSAVAIAEDGHVVGGHICSDESWIPHDLGVTSNWHHEGYRKHYPDGFDVVFVPYHEVDGHEGLQEAFRRHADLADEEAAQ